MTTYARARINVDEHRRPSARVNVDDVRAIATVVLAGPPGPPGPTGEMPYNLTVGPTAPTDPAIFDLWVDTT